MDIYILDDSRNAIRCGMDEWGEFMSDPSKRIVARSTLSVSEVSTVFLGMDHSFMEGPPLLFETMVFGGKHDGYMERYCTWEEAQAGHDRVCYMVDKESIDRDAKIRSLGI